MIKACPFLGIKLIVREWQKTAARAINLQTKIKLSPSTKPAAPPGEIIDYGIRADETVKLRCSIVILVGNILGLPKSRPILKLTFGADHSSQ